MNILLISTLNFNPGDEIIRLGVENVLSQALPGARMKIMHKHDPRTLFSNFKQRARSPHRLVAPYLYRLYASLAGRRVENYLETADLVVFAGTPFIWRSTVRLFPFTCENAEWVDATWRRLFNELKDKPVINLAAGTVVTNREQYDGILADPVVGGFLKQAVERSRLTTARDTNTQTVLAALGLETPILPCASILAAKGAGVSPQDPEYVAVNLMPCAVHKWRGERSNSEHWRRTIEEVVADIEKRHKLLFISHDEKEDKTARDWFPNHPRFLSRNPVELLRAYSKALYGICNRVHAAAAVASLGRPAILIGGDSRINLIEQFGLPALDNRELDGAKLSLIVRELEDNYDVYVENLKRRTLCAETEYLSRIRNALKMTEIPVTAG